jgi:hypothetical protein
MLVIRKEQIEVFRQQALLEFEDRTYDRLLSIKPQECTALGEEAVRESIRAGVQKAVGYGIERAVDIGKYITVMYTLGNEFDTDPLYPWAKSILNDTALDGETKATRVCALSAMQTSSGKSPAANG